jgi:pimeloyl-ACP methyl ester carboxylesterase
VKRETMAVDNGAGWQLELTRFWDPDRLDRSRRPLVMVPGYAMNSFILSFHPSGPSMISYLVDDGLEVWTTDLRAQGGSRRTGRRRLMHFGDPFGLGELALDDLPAMLGRVRAETASTADAIDAVGCSLGATMLYAYLAHHTTDHGLGSMLAIGGPLRWESVHPALRLAFSSPRVAGLLPFAGTRALARLALPVVKRTPGLLSLYMNAREIDLSNADALVQTVEDPVPYINRQVAHWVRDRDLVVRGVNTTDALRGLDLDVLVVLANRDGIVPADAARSAQAIIGAHRVDVLEVGTEERWYAHADLFIGPRADAEVFEPMRAWLRGR